ncbi:peptide deformylase [Angomonas deanei]|nr:peptide deformylase [Angomonas deanei]|eukprot:EPY40645.1 peptide deformylase [Angomonas deanei]
MYGMWENCISCGAVHAWVLRPQRITCKGLDEFGKEKCEVLDGMRARCFMHELDHIKGKTIIQRALDPEFVVSGISMSQKDLWPANFPSAEAYVTPPLHFFDYVTNQVVVPKGMEWWCGQEASPSSQHFHNQRINQ